MPQALLTLALIVVFGPVFSGIGYWFGRKAAARKAARQVVEMRNRSRSDRNLLHGELALGKQREQRLMRDVAEQQKLGQALRSDWDALRRTEQDLAAQLSVTQQALLAEQRASSEKARALAVQLQRTAVALQYARKHQQLAMALQEPPRQAQGSSGQQTA